jgi:hypothetical protein
MKKTEAIALAVLHFATCLAIIAALALVFLSGCGAPPPPSDQAMGPKLIAGWYNIDAFVVKGSAEGHCAWLPSEFHQSTKVDGDGQIASPIPGEIDCRTTYVDGFELHCSAKIIKGDVSAHGVIWGTHADGLANIVGDVSGCKRLVLTFSMESVP